MSGSDFSWLTTISLLEEKSELPTAQIRWAMREILEARAETEEIKKFLLALKAKGESVGDVEALIAEMYIHCAPISISERAVDVVGTGGDVAHTINISTTAAIVAASAGARVLKHGNRASTSKSGAADLLEELGIAIMLNGDLVEKSFNEVGIGFCFAPIFHGSMKHAAVARKELGVPTVFNILGPLANPAKPSAAAIGVASERALPVVAQVLADRGVDGFVFRGDDGLDEITLTTSTTIYSIGGDKIAKSTIDPTDFGISRAPISEIVGGDPTENARITRAILAGERGAPRDAVVMTSAAAIAAYRGEVQRNPIDRLSEGITVAQEAIDSGKAVQLLSRWAEFTQKLVVA